MAEENHHKIQFYKYKNAKKLNPEEIEVISGRLTPEGSIGGDTGPTYSTFSNFTKMQELDDNVLEEISGGNMPESSVGGNSNW